MHRSTHWKDVNAYDDALQRFNPLLAGKLIAIMMVNRCSIHCIHAGSWRIQDFVDLVKSIQLK